MKKTFVRLLACFAMSVAFAQKPVINFEAAKKSYGTTISVSPMDSGVKITDGKILLSPKKEGEMYTISGYFNGQIVNKTKNTAIKLNNAYIENKAGGAAIYGEVKTEISSSKGSNNYIVSSGISPADTKPAALQGKKDLVLGGSGTLNIVGNSCHAVKCDDIKIKGSGKLYLQGTKKGSCINCDSLTVEKDKTFSAYLLNSKNGIKADKTILIQSGDFYLYDNETGFKTDLKKDAPKSPHSITLTGGTVHASGNKNLYETEKNAFKSEGTKIIEG